MRDASEPMFAYEDREVPGERGLHYPKRRWSVEGKETDGRGHPNTQPPRFLWCLASRHDYSRRPWNTGKLEVILKAEAH